MKIVFFGLREKDQDIFKGAFGNAEVLFVKEHLGPLTAGIAKDADIVSFFVNSTVDRALIDTMPNLKLLVTRSTGVDHIDIEHARQRSISIANVPGYGANTVAEFAFGLILNLSRKIPLANRSVRDGSLNQGANMEGFDLSGKTLGVIGTGRIGKTVVKIAGGFSMKVLAYDPHPDALFAAENGCAYKSFEEVLANSDILTLHCPYIKETHHLINSENIAKIKKGAYFINTARGALVDTAALISALENGDIAGAGIDVLEKEREMKGGEEGEIIELNKKLIKMDNVIVTPHIAFYTAEALAEIYRITIENIKNYIAGTPSNLV